MAPLSFPYGNRFRVRRFHAARARSGNLKTKLRPKLQLFLRLGIVAWPPIADRSAKAQEISRKNEPFPLFGDRKEPLIEKKLQRSQDFCFLTREIAATGRNAGWHAERTQRPTLCAAYRTGMRWRNFTIMYARADKTRLSGEIALKRTLGQVFSSFSVHLKQILPKSAFRQYISALSRQNRPPSVRKSTK